MKLSTLALKAVENCRALDPELYFPNWNYFHCWQIDDHVPHCLICLGGGHVNQEYGLKHNKSLNRQKAYMKNDQAKREMHALEQVRHDDWDGANRILLGKKLPRNVAELTDPHKNQLFDGWDEFNVLLDAVERNALRIQNEGY